MNIKYHCIVFEQNDFLKNQVIEELLREKSFYCISKNIPNDFWIVLNPSFLKNNNFIEKISKTNYFKKFNIEKSYFAVLVSPNLEFINWIKLRLGYFEDITNIDNKKNFKSDGVYIEIVNNNNEKLLSNNYLALTPEILTERFQSVG